VLQPDGFGPTTVIKVNGEVPLFKDGKPTTTCVDISVPGVFTNIRVYNNTVGGTPGSAEKLITIHATAGGAVSYNRLIGVSSGRDGLPDIQLEHTMNVTVGGNVCTTFQGTSRVCDIVKT
jgi:hypothetical protein